MAVVIQRQTSKGDILRISGVFITIFSLAMGLLVLFVIPGACSFLGGIELLMLGFLFVFGIITFLVGKALSWNGRKR